MKEASWGQEGQTEHPAGRWLLAGYRTAGSLSPSLPLADPAATPRAGPDQSLGVLASADSPTPLEAIRVLSQVNTGFCP